MPAPLVLEDDDAIVVERYLAAMGAADRRTGASTTQAARTCQSRIRRAGGWNQLTRAAQIDAVRKARSFTSWLMVTGQIGVDAEQLCATGLRLGNAGRLFCPHDHRWFTDICARLGTSAADTTLQWNTLVKIAVITGATTRTVTDDEFGTARAALIAAYSRRHTPSAGRTIAAVCHRLQLSLFHAGQLTTLRGPAYREPVSVTGWSTVASGFAETARRYVEQVTVSLRPNTVKHIERDLRQFGTWLADTHPEVATCAELHREHIEAFKTWLSTHPTAATGKPLNRVSIKNALINLHCFLTRITEWGYPNAPVRPLMFPGDLPIVDKPLPRFLDDAAAAKLLRAARADPDPLSRLIVELLARTGIRRGELLALTVDAVVQIGSAYWLRIPIGKLHNDRYIPLHPQLKELLDDWITHHRPSGLRTNRLLLEHNRPISDHRITKALRHLAETAGIGNVTAHQLRHTLATQAINRGMSLDAIAALLGHKTLAMTMIYARIADRTVADEYFAVTEKVEALYDQPHRLASHDEGAEMRKLRTEMHRRMLGNGYCARPVEIDCHFESICESCSFFVTTIEFRPTLQRQRDDAATKGQLGRQKIFDSILDRLDTDAS
ncbi:MAG: tyrosine-type recombinase/integrase [Mycobacterium sp.]|uniref:tyrosine-type recombinase/integrase n=1 Tax=Mycobacterium sp. TaxID=1785 RepID=UPI003F9B8206